MVNYIFSFGVLHQGKDAIHSPDFGNLSFGYASLLQRYNHPYQVWTGEQNYPTGKGICSFI